MYSTRIKMLPVCRYFRWIFAHAEGHRGLAIKHSLLPLTNWHSLDFDNPPAHLQQVASWICMVMMLAASAAPAILWFCQQMEIRIHWPPEAH